MTEIKGIWIAVAMVVVAAIVMATLSYDYHSEKQLQQSRALTIENAEVGYKEGFGDAFAKVVECFEAREGITERDAEWKEVWNVYCKAGKGEIIKAIVMGEYITFPNAFCIKFVNLSGENITFLDEDKNPVPCGRDVLTGKCIDNVYDTPHRHVALNQREFERGVMVIKYNATQVEGITITKGLEDTYIIYMLVDDFEMPKEEVMNISEGGVSLWLWREGEDENKNV